MQLTDAQTISTLLGIAVTLVGIVLTSNHRLAVAFKEQNAENSKRFESMDQRFDKVDERFDKVDERFDTMNQDMNQRFEDVYKRFDDVNKRFDDVNKRIDGVYVQIDALRGDINRDVNERFDAMNRDVNQRFDQLNRATPPVGQPAPTNPQVHRAIS